MRSISAVHALLGVALAWPVTHARADVPVLTAAQFERLKRAVAANREAERLHRQGRMTEAIALLEKAATRIEGLLGAKSKHLANTVSSLARLLDRAGDSGRALAARERALAVAEQAFGTAHPRVVEFLVELASVLRRKGDLDRAGTLLSRAQSLIGPSTDGRRPKGIRGTVLNELGMLYATRGDYGRALKS